MLIQLRKQAITTIAALIFITLFSCKKDINNTVNNPVDELPDLTSKVTSSSVTGFVMDEFNNPVYSAAVQVGNKSAATDLNGFFEIKNVEVVKTAATVTVQKAGYFKIIKTYAAAEGKDAFFRIKLIPKILSGTIDAASGGNVALSNGLTIALPANAVVLASGSTSYTGSINVYAHWIDPTSDDKNETMPGDLRALDNDGALKGLTTFGMTVVELTSASGEPLQVATGKKATLSFPLPTAIQAVAPASIPLWYFNETNGLWQEDGSATRTGNMYVSEVSHFTFWNCDVDNAIVPLSFTLVDANGIPLGGIYVEILEDGWAYGNGQHIVGLTSLSGFTSTFVAPNKQYTLSARTFCSAVGWTSQAFTSGTTAIDLGNIVVVGGNTSTVSGTVTDCNNAPVTNGYILMRSTYHPTIQALSANGSFSFSTLTCNPGVVELIGIDIINGQQSSTLNYTLVPGANAVGTLQACGISSQEFLNITIDGNSDSYFYPVDSLFAGNAGPANIYGIGAHHIGSPTSSWTAFQINNIGIVAGSTQPMTQFESYLLPMQVTTAINVNITEYGAIGEFVAGNFAGTVTETLPPNTSHNVSCSFRTKRLN